MAVHIINSNPLTVKDISVKSTGELSQIAPSLKVGQVLPLSVHSNDGSGSGDVFIKGQVIRASVPPELLQGAQVLVELTEATDVQLLFKLIDPSTLTNSSVDKILSELTAELETIINPNSPLSSGSSTPLTLSRLTAGISSEAMARLQQVTAAITQLFDPSSTLARLIDASDGSLAESLRNIATRLNSLVETSEPPFSRISRALAERLQNILSGSLAHEGENANFNIKNLAEELGKLIYQSKDLLPAQKEILNKIKDKLISGTGTPAEDKAMLQELISELPPPLDDNAVNNSRNVLNPLHATEIKELATKLNQLASSQEALARLNPVMQAIGEPAFILFPFAIHGLLTHSEIVIDPEQRGKNKPDSENKKGGQGGDGQMFHRVTINVPLPNLGNVFVDVAHRDKEILVALTVEDPELGGFLLEQLELLSGELRAKGFEKAELSARVGKVESTPPQWTSSLQPATSIKA
ncbi:MAG: hypothetical protein PHC51_07055 [bacterium]|nr:hypothetical protein [bacterium]